MVAVHPFEVRRRNVAVVEVAREHRDVDGLQRLLDRRRCPSATQWMNSAGANARRSCSMSSGLNGTVASTLLMVRTAPAAAWWTVVGHRLLLLPLDQHDLEALEIGQLDDEVVALARGRAGGAARRAPWRSWPGRSAGEPQRAAARPDRCGP